MHSHILPFLEASPPNSKNYSAGGSLESLTGPSTTITASCTRPVAIRLPVLETQVWSLGWEDPLEKEMAAHSSILAWEIPWTEEPGGQSMGSQRVRHNLVMKPQTTVTSTHTSLSVAVFIPSCILWMGWAGTGKCFILVWVILLFLTTASWVMTVTQQLAADCSL